MFRLLKEALAVPERPEPTSAQLRSSSSTGLAHSSGTGKKAEEPKQQTGQDAPDLSDEDMLLQDSLEVLSRTKLDSKEELKLTIQVCFGELNA